MSNCSVRLSDIYDLPFSEACADATVIHQVLHFLDNPKLALAEAIRVLKPEGQLLIVDFAPHDHEFLREDHAHVRLGFAASEIESWMQECGVYPSSYRELRAEGTNEGLTVALWSGRKAEAGQDSITKRPRVTS